MAGVNRTWPNSSSRYFGQRNRNAEYISLNKLRFAAGVHLRILVGVSHTGAELISKTDFAENF